MYSYSGRYEEAIREAQSSLELVKDFPYSYWVLGETYLAKSNIDEAFKWLAYEPHHLWVPWVAVMPMWNSLHSDPRHEEFVRNLNLPGK